jgi:hypothetical protein
VNTASTRSLPALSGDIPERWRSRVSAGHLERLGLTSVRACLIFQRVFSDPHVSERSPSVRRCAGDFAIPEVLRCSPAMTCRQLKFFCGRLVDEGGVFEGLFAHRGKIAPVLRVYSRTLAQPNA